MKMKPADHPIWPLLTTVAHLTCLTIVLAIFANKFDYTELRSIGLVAVEIGLVEYGRRWLKKRNEQSQKGEG